MMQAAEQETAAWRLFKIAYRVDIKEMFFYDKDVVAHYGRPTSGNKAVDQSVMNSYRTVMIPVCNDGDKNSIVKFFSMGADVVFRDLNDIPIVYRDIVNHLTDWEMALVNHLHGMEEPPLDDLIQLDNLQAALFLLTQSNEDMVKKRTGKLVNRRSFTRRRSPFNNEYHQEEVEEKFNPDGSHIFQPGMHGMTSPAPDVSDSKEKEAKNITKHMDKLGNRGVKSFAALFERYAANKAASESEDQWDD